MNILLAVRDQLVGLFSHVRARQGKDGQCIAVEITIKLPNEKDRRCLVVRIIQDDNILEMTLHNLTGQLPHLAPKTFDIFDPNFLDRLIAAIQLYLVAV